MTKDYSYLPHKTEAEWLEQFEQQGHPRGVYYAKHILAETNWDQLINPQIELYRLYDDLQAVFVNADKEDRAAAIIDKRSALWARNKGKEDLMSDDIDVVRALALYYHNSHNKLSVEAYDSNQIISLIEQAQNAQAAADKAMAVREYKRQKAARK